MSNKPYLDDFMLPITTVEVVREVIFRSSSFESVTRPPDISEMYKQVKTTNTCRLKITISQVLTMIFSKSHTSPIDFKKFSTAG